MGGYYYFLVTGESQCMHDVIHFVHLVRDAFCTVEVRRSKRMHAIVSLRIHTLGIEPRIHVGILRRRWNQNRNVQ